MPDEESSKSTQSISDTDETPFKCQFSGCTASYRRKEHLQRHRAKHSQHEPIRCSNCGREFGRSDTLRRHLRQHHKVNEPSHRARKACESCHLAKSRCEGGPPCGECVHREIECIFKSDNSIIQKKSARAEGSSTHDSATTSDISQPTSLTEKRDTYIELYFERLHPHWSFIHQGSFYAPREVPLMVQSMIVIGLWATGEPTSQTAAKDLHHKIDAAIRDQTEKWDASDHDGVSSTCRWPIATFQAILLHIIFSCMIESSNTFDFELKFSVSPKTIELLAALVRSCRRLGMFHYPNILAQYRDSGDENLSIIVIEEAKRFNLALYKISNKLSRLGPGGTGFKPNTVKGSDIQDWQVTASELEFPVPKGRAVWDATNRKEWKLAFPIGSVQVGAELEDLAEENWISRYADILEYI